ncbi:MAG: superoxide dismutase family protein [Tuberibacillus sp.]
MTLKKCIMICLGIILLAPLPLTGAAERVEAEELKAEEASPVAVLLKDANGKVVGQAMLGQAEDGVTVQLYVQGIKPGLHGIHFHEKGVCKPKDFKSAGEHFNPLGKEHGLKNPKGPHAGDLKNVFADQNGNIQTSFTTTLVTLEKGQKNSLRDKNGSALVIHAGEDDQMTNPAGNSGDRIICGEIR